MKKNVIIFLSGIFFTVIIGFIMASTSSTNIALSDASVDKIERDAEVSEDGNSIYLSAKNGSGIDLLRQHLKSCMGYKQKNEGQFIARRRHLDAIDSAEENLNIADKNLHELKAGELLAEELRFAQQALSSITGEFSSDDLLGRIFTDFCITLSSSRFF